jgi:transcriptional regulator with XRE-family HTH domain
MPKRDTVQPNVDLIAGKVSAKSWSEASFSKMIGKHKRWLSEVRRGKNLPSPEEAARMCVLLQTTPEEILTEQADIDLVKGLLENDPGIKEARATEGEGYTELQKAAIQFVLSLPPEKLAMFLKMGRAAFEEDQ